MLQSRSPQTNGWRWSVSTLGIESEECLCFWSTSHWITWHTGMYLESVTCGSCLSSNVKAKKLDLTAQFASTPSHLSEHKCDPLTGTDTSYGAFFDFKMGPKVLPTLVQQERQSWQTVWFRALTGESKGGAQWHDPLARVKWRVIQNRKAPLLFWSGGLSPSRIPWSGH